MLFLFFVVALSETLYYNVNTKSTNVIDYERYDVDTCYMTKDSEFFQITVASKVYTRKYFTDVECKKPGSTATENIQFEDKNSKWKKTIDAKFTKKVVFTAEKKASCPNKDKKMAGVYKNDVCYKDGEKYKKAIILNESGVKKWSLAVYSDATCTKQTETPNKVECNKCTSDVYTACYESLTPDSSVLTFVLFAFAIIAFFF
ncbi:hypothetical protein EIN_141070 [Entamoeba invadens IP1]|uniref:Uncharacterized protein n=1 Tax=Entamoeba invadens IP1 TaxID=370355 RepID=L7FLZ4_ENTIV|nr:hypothetical protein EIN_141070 [Entamoeba invadens IP1]ELP88039.1 hypothetical protein EIN_141070 [Entamoeba invadens IP1]|eukprot:XP_004254810.1 hypothetical protein EIN_141070 [Entamoeba invadens IP1]